MEISSFADGSHSLTALYEGNSTYAVSTSNAITFDVVNIKSATTTTLFVHPNPAKAGQWLRLTVKVSPSAATGSVLFFDCGHLIGSGALSNGIVSVITKPLALGKHNLFAYYSGDTIFSDSNSQIVFLKVKPDHCLFKKKKRKKLPRGCEKGVQLKRKLPENSEYNLFFKERALMPS